MFIIISAVRCYHDYFNSIKRRHKTLHPKDQNCVANSKNIRCPEIFPRFSEAAQNLYILSRFAADDDGFVDCVQAVKRQARYRLDALDELARNNFVSMFADDLLLIRHWCAMNKMPPSKRRETRYPALLAGLKVGENGAYEVVNKMSH